MGTEGPAGAPGPLCPFCGEVAREVIRVGEAMICAGCVARFHRRLARRCLGGWLRRLLGNLALKPGGRARVDGGHRT